MPYSAGRMLASKMAYSARNSAGRIYPSLARGGKVKRRLVVLCCERISKQLSAISIGKKNQIKKNTLDNDKLKGKS